MSGAPVSRVFGEETRASYYHGKKEANPFHIDYCFVPEALVDRLTGVEVGRFADWPQSDHRPLTVVIDVRDETDFKELR